MDRKAPLMPSRHPVNRQQLTVLDLLNTPVWIFDIDYSRMWWANRVAVNLWDARNLDELLARDMASDMTASVRIRLRHYLTAFREGRSLVENWTFFPRGQPVTVNCTCSGVPLPDGRTAMLVEGSVGQQFDSDVLRSVEALRHTPLMISLYDREGVLLSDNPAAREALPGDRTFSGHFLVPEDAQAVLKGLETSDHCRLEARVHTRLSSCWHELTVSHSYDPATGRPMLLVGEHDVTDRRQAEELLHRARNELESRVAERTRELIHANRALIHSNTALTKEIEQRRRAEEALRQTQEALEARVVERTRELAATVARLNDEVAERRYAEDRIRELAHHDPLTGLPNRSLLMDRLEQASARACRSGGQVAVLFIDLDRFKTINDTLGHRVGDLLLQAVAAKLKECVRISDTVARLGGDEFVIVLPGLEDTHTVAARVAEDIQHILAQPLAIEGFKLHIGASVGISLYPDDGLEVATLIQKADAAMYRVKETRRQTRAASCAGEGLPARRRLSG